MNPKKNVILPDSGVQFVGWWLNEIVKFREVFLSLMIRDIKLRYRHAALGILWVVIQPAFTMAIVYFIFSKHFSNPALDFTTYVFAGMIAWQWFASTILQASTSLIEDAKLVQKIYFPRIIIPAASVLSFAFDFLISIAALFALCWFRNAHLDFKPLIFLISIMMILGLNVFLGGALAYLSATYKDFKYVLPFIAQLGFFLTPVIYDFSVIPEKFKSLFLANPFCLPIELFRYSLFEGYTLQFNPWFAMIPIVAIVVIAFAVFKKCEFILAERL